jgi:tRNA A-37 threonylcarbamoyl transferase component Bud32
MAAKQRKRRSGARRRDTLERYLFPSKPTSKKASSGARAKTKKTSSSPKRATKKAAARGKKTGKKATPRGKQAVKKVVRAPKKAASSGKKAIKKTARASKKALAKQAARKVSGRKPAVKKASAKSKSKIKTKKTPVRSAKTPKKAAARGKKVEKKAVSRGKNVVKKAARTPKKNTARKAVKARPAARKVSRAKQAASSRAKPAAKKKAARVKPAAKTDKKAVRAKAAAPAAPVRGKNTLDNYKIMGVIGEGGMGKIYKAVDIRSNKTVVMKQLIIAEREIFIKRFKREANIMLSLNHNNIVKVYDYLGRGRSYFIIMEFVDGISLEDLIRKKGKIEPLQALLIFNELCKGLKYAHDRQIIHRDIKPNNVLISKAGMVKLVDFGIAKSLQEDDEGLTKTGVVMGTPAYMSPEQLVSTKYVDNLTDIYSMGVMFYQMITGQRPYGADFTAENIRKITLGDYVSPKQLNPDLPAYCLHIVKKTMHHKKEKRVRDLEELINDMSVHLKQWGSPQQVHKEIKKALADL